MKHYLLPALLLVSGCQSTLNTEDTQQEKSQNIEAASVEEINYALLHDESIDVYHPVADVDFSLKKDAITRHDDIWQRIRDQLQFDIPENKRVKAQRDWYVKHPNYLKRVAKRAEPFLFYIVEELEKNNMPIEMALLPVVESAFDPFAYSHGRASGMWQFVPGTGKRFGMKQNWWYDGRRDVVASTQGAIAYLKYLHKYFKGDWMLALAAYNSGEGRVSRAVKKNRKNNKPTDFWSLKLPKETKAYVPKLLALADIVKRPQEFELNLYQIDNKAVISQVDIKSQLDLAKAAQLADLSLTELQRLNPGFNRWATDPDGPHHLLLPNQKIEKFEQELAKLSQSDRLAWQRYKIKNGDNLGAIAKQFHTSISLIKEVNNVKGTQIRAGKYLLIPVAAKSLDNYILSYDQRIAKKQSRPQQGTKVIHTVVSGDNLWDIGQKYSVNSKSIAKWNGFAPRDTLKLGQKLVIWQKPKTTVANVKYNKSSNVQTEQAIMRNITYKVRRGDSFARIADKFNVRIADIERWNNLNRKKYLQPGQRLKLSVDVTNNI
ncbi:lytic transglycosylase [Litorilituus lipolyticus]|uniref:LysM peptidoglycan-binding domain-containing protein n=1 Tax=Litorilituus lipolyticus TaxID=2491017 RepID=A0A502L0Q7_9GAMM|nr:LysM peptidoglycan-binding domain-containing protein [Litorilituus lipolyticus]TPH15881.1 LysM peptidoglycan-binding domain-containing protein [Litorilituus lipolyticus]